MRFSDFATQVLILIGGLAIGFGLGTLGVAKWLCWAAFGVILFARLAHGWITTQRPMPAGPAPIGVRAPLDILTVGTLWAAVLR